MAINFYALASHDAIALAASVHAPCRMIIPAPGTTYAMSSFCLRHYFLMPAMVMMRRLLMVPAFDTIKATGHVSRAAIYFLAYILRFDDAMAPTTV